MKFRNAILAGGAAAGAVMVPLSAAVAQESVFYRFEETGSSVSLALYVAEQGETETRVILVHSGDETGYWDITLSHDCESPGTFAERGYHTPWGSGRRVELVPWGFSDLLAAQLGMPRGVFHRMMNCDTQHIRGTRIGGQDAALRDAANWALQH